MLQSWITVELENETIRGTAHVRCFADKVRCVQIEMVFGDVMRMKGFELPGNRRPRGRPTRRFMDVAMEDLKSKMKHISSHYYCYNFSQLCSKLNTNYIFFNLCFCIKLQHGLSSSRLDKAALQKRNIYMV